jgi:hypothetical protein
MPRRFDGEGAAWCGENGAGIEALGQIRPQLDDDLSS